MRIEEIWKPIVGYEGHYSVSSTGRIRSETRYLSKAGFKFLSKGRLLKQGTSKDGYKTAMLSLNNTQKLFRSHRLVAIAFIPNPENKPFINHINNIRDDNNLHNLEWCTPSENTQQGIRLGTIRPGYNKGWRKDPYICEYCEKPFHGRVKFGIKQRFCCNVCKMWARFNKPKPDEIASLR